MPPQSSRTHLYIWGVRNLKHYEAQLGGRTDACDITGTLLAMDSRHADSLRAAATEGHSRLMCTINIELQATDIGLLPRAPSAHPFAAVLPPLPQ